MSYIYLASPYSDVNPLVTKERAEAALACFIWHCKQGLHVFSPIVHCHPAALHGDLPGDIDFWREYNRVMLGQASEVRVLLLPRWQYSKGVAWERETARKLGLPVTFLGVWTNAEGELEYEISGQVT